MPQKGKTERGDQYVRLSISLPTPLSEAEKALYQQIKDLKKGR
jgi:DnaJ-class molecular chaperone